MRRTLPAVFLALLCALAAAPLAAVAFAELPLAFEPNLGQTDEVVRFMSRGKGYALFLTGAEAVLRLHQPQKNGTVVRMRLEGARAGAPARGDEPLPGVSHYYRGNDPAQWRTDVPQYARVRYSEVYPGIDLVYYGNQGRLEYDFVLAPGADPDAIALRFDGVAGAALDAAGDLSLPVGGRRLVLRRPLAYQEIAGVRREVSSRYRLEAGGRLGFELAAYDRSLPLVIDPLLVYSSFYGGVDTDEIEALAADAAGNVYVTGGTDSLDFPEPGDQPRSQALYVAKFDPSGANLLYSVFVDGFSLDQPLAIAVDPLGRVYVTGETASDDFPTHLAFQPTFDPGVVIPWHAGSREAFVFSLAQAGALRYSTFLGGRYREAGQAIAADAAGRAYVAGFTDSNNFPLENEFQGDGSDDNGFITIFAPDGQSLEYSTLLRGNGDDSIHGIAVDAAGNAYVTGETRSGDFPVRAPVGSQPHRATNQGGQDAFVAKLNPNLTGPNTLVYSTYLGGGGTDSGKAIAVDALGVAYVTGATGSTNFPLVAPGGRPVLDASNVGSDAFVVKLNALGSGLFFSTFFGGTLAEVGSGIAVDGARHVYITGNTASSSGFPIKNPFQATLRGGRDAFAAKIDPATSSLLWSTYFGGADDDFGNDVALDAAGNVYLGGTTLSGGTFPRRAAFQSTFGGSPSDGFFAKFKATAADTIGVFRPAEGKFLLRNSNTAGNADRTITHGQVGDLPVAGLEPGHRIVGVFRGNTFLLRPFDNSFVLCCIAPFVFGQAGDLPVMGDWDGDGVDTVGVFRNGLWELRNSNTAGAPDLSFGFGGAGFLPVAGDWNGDGVDTIGVFDPAVGAFFLRNSNDSGTADVIVTFGQAGDEVVTGDWDGDGVDTIGVYRGDTFLLRNSNTDGPPDLTIVFGAAGDLPVAADWDAKP